jgi:5-methylcytosine-specific restriction endonuclease McrA
LRGEHSGRWKGGVDHYGPTWKKQRAAAIRRDHARCQHCGQGRGFFRARVLDVHHIQPFRTFNGDSGTANRLDNLITLCKKCHGMAERGAISIQPKLL